jgi:hypothetical protein
MELFVPIIETDSTTTIDGIEHWAKGNVTPDSRNRVRLILDMYAKPKDREFANVSKRWISIGSGAIRPMTRRANRRSFTP